MRSPFQKRMEQLLTDVVFRVVRKAMASIEKRRTDAIDQVGPAAPGRPVDEVARDLEVALNPGVKDEQTRSFIRQAAEALVRGERPESPIAKLRSRDPGEQ